MVLMLEVNYLAVLVSAIISMIIGFLWYGPLFGKQWMALMGFKVKDMEKAKEKGMMTSYLAAFIGALLMAFVLAHVIVAFEATTILEGIQGGFWVWLGFIVTTMLGSVLWEGKSIKLFWLNSIHSLVVLAITGAILAVWR